MALQRLIIVVLLATTVLTQVSAKRGCAAFGHSCYGGHGKRSDNIGSDGIPDDRFNELLDSQQPGQEEIPTHAVYPSKAVFSSSGEMIPVRGGSEYSAQDLLIRAMMQDRFRSMLRDWMLNYRQSGEQPEIYAFENSL